MLKKYDKIRIYGHFVESLKHTKNIADKVAITASTFWTK